MGRSKAKFSVLASPDLPHTGDDQPLLLYWVLALLALLSAIVLLRFRRLRRC